MPTILIIFGFSGDLARRKLVPTLEALRARNLLPEQLRIVGVSRKQGSGYFTMDVEDPHEYQRLSEHLTSIEQERGTEAQRLFHLAVPPSAMPTLIDGLGSSGLAKIRAKILLEKPFGTDLVTATELGTRLAKHFSETQIYRIDHYLEKELARELTAWHPESIEKIEISAFESLGVEGRNTFYENTGALCDVVQNHLLSLLALTLADRNASSLPEARCAALCALTPIAKDEVRQSTFRGQYEGYRAEVGNPTSTTETFASLQFSLNSAPIRLSTGKALNTKRTEVRIFLKGAEPIVFTDTPKDPMLSGYGNVFLDAIAGDQSYFVSLPESLAAWRLIENVQNAWKGSAEGLVMYQKGSAPEQLSAS